MKSLGRLHVSAPFRQAVSTLFLLLLCVSACKDRADSLDTIANNYVRIALELGERDPDSLDFAVVSPTLRDEVHRAYPSLDAIDRENANLLSRLQSIPKVNEQQTRAQFLIDQLHAVHQRIAMLKGSNLDFASEASVLFQTQPLPDTAAQERIVLRARIAVLLQSQKPSLAASYAAYGRRFLIPPDRLPDVMKAALASCRKQTLSYLTLPPDESVDVIFVRNQPWSAFSRFQGNAHSTIAINTGFPITIDQALELACHEGYPGHHVFNTLRDIALVQQKHWPEAEVQLTFSPQSYLSESAAAYAPRLAFTGEERFHIERDILFPLAGLPPAEAERYATITSLVRRLDTAQPQIAQQYLDGQLEFVRAAHQLQSESLMEHSEATLLYLNEYRSYMLAYTGGPRRIAAFVEHTNPEKDRHDAWKRYAQLTQRMSLPPAQEERIQKSIE